MEDERDLELELLEDQARQVRVDYAILEEEYKTLESNFDQLAADYEDLLSQQQDLLAWVLRLMGQGEMQEAADEIKYHLAKLGYFAGDIRVR